MFLVQLKCILGSITKDEWFDMRSLAKDRSIVIVPLSGVGKIN